MSACARASASSRSLMIETKSFGEFAERALNVNASGQREQISDTMVHLPKKQFILFLRFATVRNVARNFEAPMILPSEINDRRDS